VWKRRAWRGIIRCTKGRYVLAPSIDLRAGEQEVLSHLREGSGLERDDRAALIARVLASKTFEHSPKLRAFFEYACRCAIEDEPAAATEQQIGIHVFGRTPGYNTSEDNIVRSQARWLRLKLEHHFANEAKNEPVIITIPKGRYLPSFEPRTEGTFAFDVEAASGSEETSAEPGSATVAVGQILAEVTDRPTPRPRWPFWLIAAVIVLGIALYTLSYFRTKHIVPNTTGQSQAIAGGRSPDPGTAAGGSEIRMAVGYDGPPFMDKEGRLWIADQYFHGGESEPGPQELFPPVANPMVFSRIREGVSLSAHAEGSFQYDIPVSPGVYELRLYFADPIRHALPGQDGQHVRHFQVNLNGSPILSNFDAVADAGASAVDVRAFKDVSPAGDGKIHLDFLPAADRPFLSALELTPGTPGKLRPVRFTAQTKEVVDASGTRWSGDEYFMYGNTLEYSSPESTTPIQPIYTVERFGNFDYAIPIPPGSYTIRLYFMESFWGSNGLCSGVGCRIFSVSCNGVSILKDFDILQAAGGPFIPVIRTFSGLHPNGQGKLLLSFSPSVDYAEIRAIEVIDDGAGPQVKKR